MWQTPSPSRPAPQPRPTIARGQRRRGIGRRAKRGGSFVSLQRRAGVLPFGRDAGYPTPVVRWVNGRGPWRCDLVSRLAIEDGTSSTLGDPSAEIGRGRLPSRSCSRGGGWAHPTRYRLRQSRHVVDAPLSTAPCRRAPGSGIDDVRPWLVYRSRPRLGGATARNPGAPPRRPVVTERASGRAPAARSHTPNHYVGLWDRVAVTRWMQIGVRGGGAGLGLVGQGSLLEECRFQEFPGGGGQTKRRRRGLGGRLSWGVVVMLGLR